jgi:alkylation response protein AidB-like acyl-CoA dehydrogenase
MDFALTEEQRRLQATCRELAADFAKRAAEHDRDASPPRENYDALRKAGINALTIPKEFGGQGGGLLGYAIAAEEIAQGDAATALSYNMHHANMAAIFFESPVARETKQRIADLVIKEGKLTADSVSEPGTTSLVPTSYACSCQAKRVPGGIELNGRKAFVSMFESADYTLMFAHPEWDPNPEAGIGFLLPAKSPGIRVERVWDTLGMRATRSDTVILEKCFVPQEFVLEEFYVPSIWGWLQDNEPIFNIPYTAVYLGVGVAALKAAIATVSKRVPKGFKQSLAYHPDVRRRIALMACQLDAARWVLRYAAWRVDTEGQNPETVTLYLKAKYLVGEATAAATRSALEMGGAHAIFKGQPIERLFRDGATASMQHPPSDLCLSQVSIHELGLDREQIRPWLKPGWD